MMPMQSQQSSTDINHFQDMMSNVVYNVCSIVVIPVEMLLRPQYGSQYLPPVLMFFTAILMVLLPLFSALADGFGRMLPFVRFDASAGLFGIGTISRLFFLGAFVHNIRIWRRMVHPEKEKISTYEGPPLPFFRLLPLTFWMTRIIVEPVFVFATAILLSNFFILQPSAAHYLMIAAIMLAMKQYVAWYKNWQIIRGALDSKNLAPVLAKYMDNTATDEDLATAHLASLPKDTPDDFRRETARHIARALSPGTN